MATLNDTALRNLETLTPAQVNQILLASLPRSVVSGLREKTVDRTTKEYGFDIEVVGYEFDGRAPEADVVAALMILEEANKPCPPDIASGAVGTLRVRTARRAEDQGDMDLTVAVYAEDLEEFPADVVIDACKAWARQNKWFPSCAEIREMCQFRVKKRKMMLDALKRSARDR